MSKINRINSINECPPDGRVIVAYCEHQKNVPAQCRNGKGDHAVISTQKGSCAVPLRPIGKGLFCKIIKALVGIGITAFVIACATGYIAF